VAQLLQRVVPDSTLAELTALESIFKALASDKEEKLHVAQLLTPLIHQMAASYTELKQQQQEQQKQQEEAGLGANTGANAVQQQRQAGDEDTDMADGGVEQVGTLPYARVVSLLHALDFWCKPASCACPHAEILQDQLKASLLFSWHCLTHNSSFAQGHS
jgi:hypothetical protein